MHNRKFIFGASIVLFFIVLGLLGKFIAPFSPLAQSGAPWSPPSARHVLGTNYLGQDVFSWFVIGTATSLKVGFFVALFSSSIGISVGLTAGYLGKYTDDVLMRFVDMLLVIPAFPLLVILSAYLPPTNTSTILILSLLSWPFMSRVVRSQVLTLKERGYVAVSKLSGSGNLSIMFKDIFPNMAPIIFINMIFLVIGAIIAQAGLAFFGLGNVNSINWGTMLFFIVLGSGRRCCNSECVVVDSPTGHCHRRPGHGSEHARKRNSRDYTGNENGVTAHGIA